MVCCYRRATSSQRHSTTISWPLGAGQLWLVSTALLFYWQSPALVVVAALCPGNSGHRLWLRERRGIGGKGQWVYNWIQHIHIQCSCLTGIQSQLMSTDQATAWCHLLWIQATTLWFCSYVHYIYFFSRLCSPLFPPFPWEFTTIFLPFPDLNFAYFVLFSRFTSWLVQMAHNLSSCNKLAPQCSRLQSMTDKQRILNVSSFLHWINYRPNQDLG